MSRTDRQAVYAMLDEIGTQPPRVLVDRIGCCRRHAQELLAEWSARKSPAAIPLPRWCQPARSRPRYRIDDAFPSDREQCL